MQNKSKFKVIMLTIIILLVGGAVYYFINYKKEKISDTLGINSNGGWIHSGEEDTQNNLIYRNSETYTPPPSRFRETFYFLKGNRCSSLQLAPNDGHYFKNVRCSISNKGEDLILKLQGKEYIIIEKSEFELVLQEM